MADELRAWSSCAEGGWFRFRRQDGCAGDGGGRRRRRDGRRWLTRPAMRWPRRWSELLRTLRPGSVRDRVEGCCLEPLFAAALAVLIACLLAGRDGWRKRRRSAQLEHLRRLSFFSSLVSMSTHSTTFGRGLPRSCAALGDPQQLPHTCCRSRPSPCRSQPPLPPGVVR